MTSYQPGPFFGLSMVLNIDQSVYMKRGQSKQAGARLVVHDSKEDATDNIFFVSYELVKQPSYYCTSSK